MACHRFEETGPVSIDHDRVNERHLLEFSGGRDSDIYGEHKDFDSVLAKSRPKSVPCFILDLDVQLMD